jgi:hypothetical protein
MSESKKSLMGYLPRITNGIILLIILLYIGIAQDWRKPNRVIESDVMGYYLYLPAVVINNDITLQYIFKNFNFYKDRVWFQITPDNQRVIQFTYGLSLLYSPFFITAHLVAPVFGYEANGYTVPYKIALLASCVFYLIIGLIFLRKILSRYFSPLVVSITLLSVALGTNLLYYATYEAPMSHAYNFALITIFLYLLIRWLEKPSLQITIFLGLFTGLITLVRPSNTVVVILFFCWGINSIEAFKRRILFLVKSYGYIITMLFLCLIVWIPQFLYWHKMTGSYLYFSYGQRAWFFFNDPQIINVLFSYRKGWLVYTPIMFLSLAGIPLLYKRIKGIIFPVLVFFILNLYIISSWWDWWYGGGYGLRAFIDSYGLMAIPLGAFIKWFLDRRWLLKIAFLTITAVMIFHNNFQIAQYRHGAIHFVSMTKEAYWESFGKLRPTAKFYKYLKYPDYEGIQKKIEQERLKRKKKKQE